MLRQTTKSFLASGHLPTLLTAFLYFDVSFMVWVVNGALAPFITQEFSLTPTQTGMLISLPVLSGAVYRIPFGLLAEIIGRKPAALLGPSRLEGAL